MQTEIKPTHSHPHGCRKRHQFLPVIFTLVQCLITIISQIHTQCIKAPVNQILFFYRLGFSTVMKLNDPLLKLGTMSRSSLQIHREDYMYLVVFIKLTAFLAETPLCLLLGGLSRQLSLCAYLLLDGHCIMSTEQEQQDIHS